MCVIFSLHYSRSEGQDLQMWSLFRMACTSFFKHFSQMTQGQMTFSCPVFSSSAWDASFTLSAVSSSVRQVSWGDDNRLLWHAVNNAFKENASVTQALENLSNKLHFGNRIPWLTTAHERQPRISVWKNSAPKWKRTTDDRGDRRTPRQGTKFYPILFLHICQTKAETHAQIVWANPSRNSLSMRQSFWPY